MEKRVLIIVENLPLPEDRKVWREIKALKERGFKVFAISPSPFKFCWHRFINGIEIYHYPRTFYTKKKISYLFEYLNAFFWTSLLSFYLFFKKRINILQVCNPPEIFFLLGLVIKLRGGYFVFDHHDLSPEMYEARFRRKDFFYYLLRIFEFLTVKISDKVIEPNRYYKEIVRRRTFSSNEKLTIIPTSIDLKEIYCDEKDKSLKRGRKYMICYLGVINPQDGVNNLIEAINYLVKRNFRDFISYIIGDGDAREDLEKLVKMENLEKYMSFTGWIFSFKRLRRYLSTCDVCVDSMPFNTYSNFSTLNKILEYMAMGKPVVTFDLEMTKRILGKAGYFAEPDNIADLGEKIKKLLENKRERIKMGKIARKKIEKEFDWEKAKSLYVKVFKM